MPAEPHLNAKDVHVVTQCNYLHLAALLAEHVDIEP
jgi:hypothetical protein